MDIVLRTLDTIRPYPGNPRSNDHAVEAVAASLREFGFRQPIVVDADGVIVAGHTRYKAAKRLRLDRVPVHVATDLTVDQIRAYRLADNKTAEHAEWDLDLLPIELAALQDADYDLGLLGFDPDDLAKLLDPGVKDGLTDPDDVPAPPDAATTRPGDLWLLGEHRLLCGDSSNHLDVDRLLGGAPVHLVNTDPPYGVAVEPRSNSAIAAGLSSFEATPAKGRAAPQKLRAKDRPIANDAATGDAFDQLLDAWFGNLARVLLPGRGFYIWGGYGNLGSYPPVLKRHGLHFAQAIIWDKQHPVMGRKDFLGAYEACFYGWRSGAAHVFLGPKNITDLWHVKKVTASAMVHLTEKPVELAVRAMRYSSREGEHVLDLFGGSGSTLIAAEQTRRKAFLMELDPLYCDVILDRFHRFTAVDPVLAAGGTPWSVLKAEPAEPAAA